MNITWNPKGPATQIAWDKKLTGLGLRAWPSGRKAWVYRYRLHRKQRIVRLGDAAALGLSEARALAREYAGAVAAGRDPRAAVDTLSALWAQWQADPSWQRLSAPSRAAYARHWRLRLAPTLGHMPVDKVTRSDVRALALKLAAKSKSGASGALAALSGVLEYGIQIGLIETNVARGHRLGAAVACAPRSRTLTDGELSRLMGAGPEMPERAWDVIRLLLLYGCRLREITNLQWEEVHDDAIRIPAERIKTRRPLVLPMLMLARSIIDMQPQADAGPVFGYSGRRVGVHLARAVGCAPHDLRRTMSSRLIAKGWSDGDVGLVLNHTPAGMLRHYVAGEFLDRKREILETWENELMRLWGFNVIRPDRKP